MRKLTLLPLTFICAFTTWAIQMPAQVKYTVTNFSSTTWSGEISSCESNSGCFSDCHAIRKQSITIFPYGSTNNEFNFIRNMDSSVKDNLTIKLNSGLKTISWSNLTYISYPGVQFIESVNCVIPNSGDELICDFE